MSASSVARWNSIPSSRADDSSLKHPRPEEEQGGDDDSNDDVSIVSRTPSPDVMDVDGSLDKYDEYIPGTPREVITVETKIKPTNKGFTMLANLGWSEGQPLGISGDGRVDPIPFQIKRDLTGLGKTNQDVRMIETTVSQRRGLDSERQRKETEDQRRAREDLVARKSALQSEISTTLKAFYCTLCDKQFKNVAQYDEHTNSYAHHHKARFKDMQANVRLKPKEEVDKRKEKERKREEKELRKIAAANGIRMAKPTTALSAPSNPAASTGTNTEVEPSAESPKRPGWASLSGTVESAPPRSGWASVGPSLPAAEPPGTAGLAPASSSSSTRPGASAPPSAPTFRTAGWTSLDTGSSQTFPPLISSSASSPPPIATPPPPPSRGARSSIANSAQLPSSGGWGTTPVSSNSPPPPPPSAAPPPPPQSHPLSAQNLEPNVPTTKPPQPVRSGWQQFQKSGGPKRR